MTMELPGVKTPVKTQLLFKEPGLLRTEAVPAGGPVIIFDPKAGKRLILDPAAKSATLLDGSLPGEPKGAGPDQAAGAAEGLRNLANKKGEPVGRRRSARSRRRASGSRRLPVKRRSSGSIPRRSSRFRSRSAVNLGAARLSIAPSATFSSIRRLDDSLFSFEPPPGYALRKANINVAEDKDDGTPESAVARLLRMYAENSGGTFPKRIDDWVDIGEKLKGEKIQGPATPRCSRW